jgi:hypothetical protein
LLKNLEDSKKLLIFAAVIHWYMANETRANRWLELVAEDMSVAEDLYKTGHWLYVGFMCHQVIEKTLLNMNQLWFWHDSCIFSSRHSNIYTH